MVNRFFHVTPLSNLPDVLIGGLRIDPPRRHWNTWDVVYLSTSEQQAEKWAAEIAGRIGNEIEFALLAVNPFVPGAGAVAEEGTEIRGLRQVRVHWNIPANYVTFVRAFTAAEYAAPKP